MGFGISGVGERIVGYKEKLTLLKDVKKLDKLIKSIILTTFNFYFSNVL